MQDLLCFSHLGWNFVYQRPQHLLARFATRYRVFYFEEPTHADSNGFQSSESENVTIVQLTYNDVDNRLTQLRVALDDFIKAHNIKNFVSWYYTPMALEFSAHLQPIALIYDSMDELSQFKFAPPQLLGLETELLARADVVFTGGHTLYKAKRHRHHNIHPFPSSIDKKHFATARSLETEPSDQVMIPHPRLGFYGVVDERFDIELLREVASKKPDWQFVIIGPVVKIDPETLPKASNIHYLGKKEYGELPAYLSGWNLALLLFALNEATEFISPTKTPEYLAGGVPVISTPIKDVIEPYGNVGLVHIVRNCDEFIAAAEHELKRECREQWLLDVDAFLADKDWDNTFAQMDGLVKAAIDK